MGAADVVLVGGVEHMGHHPMGDDVDFNPRFVSERIVDESAAVMGQTAENLHDAFPHLTKENADAFAVESQRKAAKAWAEGVMDEIVVPMSVFTEDGWTVAARDEFLRPDTTMEALAELRLAAVSAAEACRAAVALARSAGWCSWSSTFRSRSGGRPSLPPAPLEGRVDAVGHVGQHDLGPLLGFVGDGLRVTYGPRRPRACRDRRARRRSRWPERSDRSPASAARRRGTWSRRADS